MQTGATLTPFSRIPVPIERDASDQPETCGYDGTRLVLAANAHGSRFNQIIEVNQCPQCGAVHLIHWKK